MARKRITSRPGLFGTVYYYDENGKPVGKSRPGLLEGTRVYTDQNGKYAGKSRPGFLAKEVFTDADHNHITSYEDLCGDIHFQNGVPIGHTRPGFFGFDHTTIETDDDSSEEEYYEEDYFTEDITEEWDETEADDLCEDDYEEHTSQVSQYTVVKNLQLFVLCLVICMVIACIYAIVRLN